MGIEGNRIEGEFEEEGKEFKNTVFQRARVVTLLLG